MTTLEQALIDFVRAKDEVRRITLEIRDWLGSRRQITISEVFYEDTRKEPAEWLKEAYEMEFDGYDQYYANHDDDIEGFLAENCIRALNAHHLIQERKEARKRLAVTRRRISLLGRNLLKKQEGEPHD